MSLVPAKCENCSGTLEVDPSLKAAICPFCSTPYVVQDAINHYHNHNHTHIHGNVINNYVDERSSEARLVAGDTCMKQEHYDSALIAYKDVCEITPQNYLGWWGQIRAITHDFALRPEIQSDLLRIKMLFKSAAVVATQEQQKELNERYNSYYLPLEKKSEAEREALKKKIADLTGEFNRLVNLHQVYNKSYRKYLNHNACRVPAWLTSILTIIVALGIIPVFTRDASPISPPVILPIAAWMFAKSICIIVNISVKASMKEMNKKCEQVSRKMGQIDLERRTATNRLSVLER